MDMISSNPTDKQGYHVDGELHGKLQGAAQSRRTHCGSMKLEPEREHPSSSRIGAAPPEEGMALLLLTELGSVRPSPAWPTHLAAPPNNEKQRTSQAQWPPCPMVNWMRSSGFSVPLKKNSSSSPTCFSGGEKADGPANLTGQDSSAQISDLSAAASGSRAPEPADPRMEDIFGDPCPCRGSSGFGASRSRSPPKLARMVFLSSSSTCMERLHGTRGSNGKGELAVLIHGGI